MPHRYKPKHHDGQSPDAKDFEWEKNKTVHHNQSGGISLIQLIALQLYMLPPPHHTMYVHTHG